MHARMGIAQREQCLGDHARQRRGHGAESEASCQIGMLASVFSDSFVERKDLAGAYQQHPSVGVLPGRLVRPIETFDSRWPGPTAAWGLRTSCGRPSVGLTGSLQRLTHRNGSGEPAGNDQRPGATIVALSARAGSGPLRSTPTASPVERGQAHHVTRGSRRSAAQSLQALSWALRQRGALQR